MLLLLRSNYSAREYCCEAPLTAGRKKLEEESSITRISLDFIIQLGQSFLHLDDHLSAAIQNYGTWTYLFLFLIVFFETGLVITPFLPGDSLLFVAGTLCAKGSLEHTWVILLLSGAAILGDTLNYGIGHLLAPRIFRGERIRFLKPEYLERTHQFFERHGGKTIILARFLPIIRTFAPFLAGAGSMNYRRFLLYNVIGGGLWVLIFIMGGYFFGNLPIVKKNFSFVILAIIVLSLVPGLVEFFRHRRNASS